MLPLLHVPLAAGGWHLVVSSYALALLVASVAGSAIFVRRCPPSLPPVLVAGALCAVVFAGGRVAALALHDADGAGLVSGSLSSSGALLVGFGVALLIARASGTPVTALLAALAPAALVAFAVGRLGCFLAGCCYGRPTDLPWGVVFPDLGPSVRHPVQLYEAGGDLLLAGAAATASSPGTAVRRGFGGYGLLRVGLEALRDPAAIDRVLGGWLPLAPVAAIVVAAVAVFLAPPGAGSVPTLDQKR